MKKLLALFAAIVLTFSFAGCSNTQQEQNTNNDTTTSAVADQQVAYPVTITDQADREVVIEKEPETIVSGYYIATSILISLGQEDNLVGIEAKADTRNIYALSAKEIISLPSVGTAKQFDLEQCAALNPDVVILPLKLKDVVESLEQLGITAIVVNPESTELMQETVEILSTALTCKELGNEIIGYANNSIQTLNDKLKDADAPTVYFAGNSSYLSTAGAKMYQNSLIENAKAVNVAKEIEDIYWAEISYEQLISWNPEYIIVASDAEYTVDDILNDSNLSSLDAVKNKNVYKIPSEFESWDSPVPSNFLGSIFVASKIHKNALDEDYLAKETKDFYSKFYGFEADTTLLD